MGIYKIKNITNEFQKRDSSYNSIVSIEYIEEMNKKTSKIKPGETLYLSISSLPLSIHKLRMSGKITVTEISKTELDSYLLSLSNKKNEINTVNEHIDNNIIDHQSVKRSQKRK